MQPICRHEQIPSLTSLSPLSRLIKIAMTAKGRPGPLQRTAFLNLSIDTCASEALPQSLYERGLFAVAGDFFRLVLVSCIQPRSISGLRAWL